MPTIRKYRDADVEQVLSVWESTQALAHRFLPDDFQDQGKKNIRELYLPNADTWVVEDDDAVVGFIANLRVVRRKMQMGQMEIS